MNLFLKKLLLVAVSLMLSGNAERCAAQEIKLGGLSATLRLNEKPTSRQITFTLPKLANGKHWKLIMFTTSATGNISAGAVGTTADGKAVSLRTYQDADVKKDEVVHTFPEAKNPITVSLTITVGLTGAPKGRGPWDGSVTLRAVEEN